MSSIAATEDPRERLVTDGVVNVEEARRFLNCSRTTLYTLMDSGELDYLKFGRNRRIPRRALIEFATSRLTAV